MADIKIEKKKNNNNNQIWIWVIALLLIGGIIWWIAAEDEEPITAYDIPETEQIQEERVSDEYLATEEEVNTATVVNEYITYVQRTYEGADFDLNHSYTSEGILKLQNALAVLARENTDLGTEIRDEMEALESYAREIQTDPEALRHAELVQLAFVQAAEIMEKIQEEEQREFVSKVAEEADDINPEVNLLDQKAAVKEFFVAASDALDRMSEEAGTLGEETSTF